MQHETRTTILDMIQASERAIRYVSERSREEFLNEDVIQYAVWAQIVILGEAVRRLPEDWEQQHPSIPWSAIAGMRHRLVHGYDVIDWNIVYAVAKRELPPLLADLHHILENLA